MSGYLRFPNINEVIISGRLVRDVEMKYSQNNVGYAKICIAVNSYIRDENGGFIEQSSFVDTIAYGKTAQTCYETLKKGSPVIIQGFLKTRTYLDQNNQNRKITEININKIYPLEKDENFVANQNYQQASQNNPTNFENPSSGNAPSTTEDQSNFPGYDASAYDINTENDVPF